MRQVILFSAGLLVGTVAGIAIATFTESSRVAGQSEAIAALESTVAEQQQRLENTREKAAELSRFLADSEREIKTRADEFSRELAKLLKDYADLGAK